MNKYGLVIVSHVPSVAEGITALLKEISGDVPITFAGGTDDGNIGSSFEKINQAVADNNAEEIFAFYDLGSAKMTLEMVIDISEKNIHLMDTALVESAYIAAALASSGSSSEVIMEKLERFKIK